jgi:hypothetical protein
MTLVLFLIFSARFFCFYYYYYYYYYFLQFVNLTFFTVLHSEKECCHFITALVSANSEILNAQLAKAFTSVFRGEEYHLDFYELRKNTTECTAMYSLKIMLTMKEKWVGHGREETIRLISFFRVLLS